MQNLKRRNRRLLLFMRIGILPLVILLFSVSMGFAKTADGQGVTDQKISLSVDNAEIKTVLQLITRKIDVKFIYSSQKIPVSQKVSVLASDEKLGIVLYKLLFPYGIGFEVEGNKIVLTKGPKNETSLSADPKEILPGQALEEVLVAGPRIVKGKVVDDKDQPLAGVSITIKGTKAGTTTNDIGVFFWKYRMKIPYFNYPMWDLWIRKFR